MTDVKSQLIPLTKVEGIQAQNGVLSLPNLRFKVDSLNRVFVRDSLVFTPTHRFKLCIFEYIKESKTVLISAISPSSSQSSLLYMFGKRDILLIPLAEKNICLYLSNMEGYYFHDFDIKNQTVSFKTYKGRIRKVKSKKISIWQ